MRFLAFILLAYPWLAIAQAPVQDEMVTDRPDFTESPNVIHPGWLQLESGIAIERTEADRTRTTSLGTPLLRVGMGKGLEFRLGTDGLLSVVDLDTQQNQFGRADAEAGFKCRLVEENRWHPALAVVAAVSIPSGSASFRNPAWQPEVNVAWTKSAPAGFGLTGNVLWTYAADRGRRFHQRALTLSVDHALRAGFGGFWEVYVISAGAVDERTSWVASTGVTRPVGRNAQWDVALFHRLGDAGPDWILSAGFSFRVRILSRKTRG